MHLYYRELGNPHLRALLTGLTSGVGKSVGRRASHSHLPGSREVGGGRYGGHLDAELEGQVQ